MKTGWKNEKIDMWRQKNITHLTSTFQLQKQENMKWYFFELKERKILFFYKSEEGGFASSEIWAPYLSSASYWLINWSFLKIPNFCITSFCIYYESFHSWLFIVSHKVHRSWEGCHKVHWRDGYGKTITRSTKVGRAVTRSTWVRRSYHMVHWVEVGRKGCYYITISFW